MRFIVGCLIMLNLICVCYKGIGGNLLILVNFVGRLGQLRGARSQLRCRIGSIVRLLFVPFGFLIG